MLDTGKKMQRLVCCAHSCCNN